MFNIKSIYLIKYKDLNRFLFYALYAESYTFNAQRYRMYNILYPMDFKVIKVQICLLLDYSLMD
jgi:hypothetical protein